MQICKRIHDRNPRHTLAFLLRINSLICHESTPINGAYLLCGFLQKILSCPNFFFRGADMKSAVEQICTV